MHRYASACDDACACGYKSRCGEEEASVGTGELPDWRGARAVSAGAGVGGDTERARTGSRQSFWRWHACTAWVQ